LNGRFVNFDNFDICALGKNCELVVAPCNVMQRGQSRPREARSPTSFRSRSAKLRIRFSVAATTRKFVEWFREEEKKIRFDASGARERALHSFVYACRARRKRKSFFRGHYSDSEYRSRRN